MARPPAGRSGTDDLKARAIAWVEQACADQNVPVKLSDPLALDRVAELLAQGRKTGSNRDSSKRL
jgi:hypothetical protein